MPHLPQELIVAIINRVGDRKTLKACSLVASSFVYLSQKLLFHTIDLDAPILSTRKKAYTRFLRLLTLHPHLGTYVRSLRLGDDPRSWIIYAKNLPHLFQLLPWLETFSLTFNSDQMNWKYIPADIRSAFGRLFCLPTLQAVSLEFIRGFPSPLLSRLTRLQQLRLSCVDVDPNDVYPHSVVSELRGLHLRGTPPSTIAAISRCLPESSPTLRRLAITPTLEPGFCSAISELMITLGSNITHFEWLPSIHFSASSVPLDIAKLPHLCFLRFTINSRKFRSNRGHFAEMLRLLEQVSMDSHNKIELIEIECSLMQWIDNKTLQAQWRPLEEVLNKVGFRNKLKEVAVKLSVSTNGTSDRRRIVIGFMDLFPSLRGRGVIISVQDQAQGDDRFVSASWNSSG